VVLHDERPFEINLINPLLAQVDVELFLEAIVDVKMAPNDVGLLG